MKKSRRLRSLATTLALAALTLPALAACSANPDQTLEEACSSIRSLAESAPTEITEIQAQAAEDPAGAAARAARLIASSTTTLAGIGNTEIRPEVDALTTSIGELLGAGSDLLSGGSLPGSAEATKVTAVSDAAAALIRRCA